MVNDSAQPQNPSVRPMNEPHIPVTEDEMNPNLHKESPSSGRNTLLTLASLLVLAGIVGITLYLYIQNRTNKTGVKAPPVQPVENKEEKNTTSNYVPKTPEELKMAENLNKYGAVCRRYTSIEEALNEVEIACVLDLSGQNLTSIPATINKLTNLQDINLDNNKITSFPDELLELPSLRRIHLSNNLIRVIPKEILSSKIEFLDVSENPIKEKLKTQNGVQPSQVEIRY